MAMASNTFDSGKSYQLQLLGEILAGAPLECCPCLLTAEEVCFLLRICDNTRNKLEKEKILVPIRINRSLRYLPRQVQVYIDSLRQAM